MSSLTPAVRLRRYNAAFAAVDAPFAFVDLEAMWANSDNMLGQIDGKPIRVASKSLRCRGLLGSVLERDGYRGLLTFTLPEALWLASEGFEDLVVAYPTADRSALRSLAALTADDPDGAPAVMVDSAEQLDLIDAAVGAVSAPLRVCLDFDASLWLAGGRVRIGPKRSPVHTPRQARRLAQEIERRPSVRLVGMMCYEGHIAGLGDVASSRTRSTAIARMQRKSYAELRDRRAEAVEAIVGVTGADLEFVNAGGTGDLQLVATEPAMTEATAGSGFYAPTLFDNYSAFSLEPAAMFAQPVVRRPGRGVVTVLGGGYLASGPGGKDRVPSPYLPEGFVLDAAEGAGEVQTPLLGAPANRMRVGDKVYFRHTKAGELCERFDRLYLVEGSAIVDELPTYRGEGKTFL